MKNENVKVGMKVVPFQKTAGCNGLDVSGVWESAKNNNQPYIYVIKWEGRKGFTNAWVLHENKDATGGDYFNSCDFKPYEEHVKGKLIFSDEVFKIGLPTPLVDIDGEPLYTGDVVAFKDGEDDDEDSIVCTKQGDIMGIWGSGQEGIEKHQIKKVKSYTELKDGEVYYSYVKVELEKIDKKEKESKLQKELRKVEARAKELRAEIQKQEHEKTVCEDIVKLDIERTENIKATQYIGKDKLNVGLHNSKNAEFTVAYRREGYKIICEFTDGTIVGTGFAKCNPDDEFNYEIGMGIAEFRARANFYNNLTGKMVEFYTK